MKHLLPIMKNNHYGNIVNFSSIGASRGTLGHTIYGAAKASVESMTRSIVAQYGKQMIRANCIRPGIMLNPVTLQNPGIDEYSGFYAISYSIYKNGYGYRCSTIRTLFSM